MVGYRLKRWWRRWVEKLEEFYWILFYNEHATTYYVMDMMLEPVYWATEGIANRAGPIFVTLVTVLTSSVVFIYYYYVLPWNYARWSFAWSLVNIPVSFWLLVNIAFNYAMGVTTKPGRPPPKVESPVSICKNCISPKPPRTHHCGICRACVLKMDHHCPWLNNCVGHFNHRYFYLFSLYMCLGTMFVSVSAYQQFWTFFDTGPVSYIMSLLSYIYNSKEDTYTSTSPAPQAINSEYIDGFSDDQNSNSKTRFWIVYEFLLCSCVCVTLAALVAWHSVLISKGETSIEKHINVRERKRYKELGAEYRNPYDFGFVENWKVFFGIERGTRRSWFHVIFPSTHKPTGDGKSWRTASQFSKVK